MFDSARFFLSPLMMLHRPPVNNNNNSSSNNTNNPVKTTSSSFLISDILDTGTDECTSPKIASKISINELRNVDENFPSDYDENSEDLEKTNTKRRLETPLLSGGKKARKARTIFTDKQLQDLESTFDKQKYLSVQDRMELAQKMGLTDTQVKTWYQNRRTKWKRQSAVGMELLSEASNYAAVQQLFRSNPYWNSYIQSAQTHPAHFLALAPTSLVRPPFPSLLTTFGQLSSTTSTSNSSFPPSTLFDPRFCNDLVRKNHSASPNSST